MLSLKTRRKGLDFISNLFAMVTLMRVWGIFVAIFHWQLAISWRIRAFGLWIFLACFLFDEIMHLHRILRLRGNSPFGGRLRNIQLQFNLIIHWFIVKLIKDIDFGQWKFLLFFLILIELGTLLLLYCWTLFVVLVLKLDLLIGLVVQGLNPVLKVDFTLRLLIATRLFHLVGYPTFADWGFSFRNLLSFCHAFI
jgi:hypothetical protein